MGKSAAKSKLSKRQADREADDEVDDDEMIQGGAGNMDNDAAPSGGADDGAQSGAEMCHGCTCTFRQQTCRMCRVSILLMLQSTKGLLLEV